MALPQINAAAPDPAWTLERARAAMAGARCWVLTDGKVGDEANCLGVTERLGLQAELRHVAPGPLHALLMPWGPTPPRDRPSRPGSPIAAPFPDLVVASGRRAVAYLRAVRAAAQGRVFTAFMKDPKVGVGAADFIWLPAHDALRGPNVLATLTSPHRVSPERLAAARAAPAPALAALAAPRLAVILGGGSRHFPFGAQDAARLAAALEKFAESGWSLMGCPSRRTSPALTDAVAGVVEARGGWFWRGDAPNPYIDMLAAADRIIVTADSVNMVGEAASTGRPVNVFEPAGRSAKIDRFLAGLMHHGAVRPLGDDLAGWTYEPLDSTPEIAIALARRYVAFRRPQP